MITNYVFFLLFTVIALKSLENLSEVHNYLRMHLSSDANVQRHNCLVHNCPRTLDFHRCLILSEIEKYVSHTFNKFQKIKIEKT